MKNHLPPCFLGTQLGNLLNAGLEKITETKGSETHITFRFHHCISLRRANSSWRPFDNVYLTQFGLNL